jgi:hypothetical protein
MTYDEMYSDLQIYAGLYCPGQDGRFVGTLKLYSGHIPVMNYAQFSSLPRVANGFKGSIVIVSLFEAFRSL